MIALVRAAWERLSLYLPVILMAILALASYWLVRSTPLLLAPEQAAPLLHEPDYFMRKFSLKMFDAAGRLKSEVVGADVRHYPDTDTLEIDAASIRALDPQGRVTTATARRALSNGDASEVRLVGDAHVVREAGLDPSGQAQPHMEFRSEFLHAFMNGQRITSDKPVQLTRGRDRLTADTLDFDNPGRVLLLQGRVKGTLSPAVSK